MKILNRMKLIQTNLFAVVTDIYSFYVEADSMEEALEIARSHTSEYIREIRAVSSYLFKKSLKQSQWKYEKI